MLLSVIFSMEYFERRFSLEKCKFLLTFPLMFKSLTRRSEYLQEARETGALKEAKDKLEKYVEDLTLRLQLEKRLRVITHSLHAQSTNNGRSIKYVSTCAFTCIFNM